MKKHKLIFLVMLIGLLFTQNAWTFPPSDDQIDLLGGEQFIQRPLETQLSEDGKTLYYGVPLAIFVFDPNPPGKTVRIPPPVDLQNLPESASSTFVIDYVPNGGLDTWGNACITFPESAKAAFNAAVSVWGNLVQSSVPIRINACWANLPSPIILGQSGVSSVWRDFSGAPLPHVWYYKSLANSLHGSELDASDYDMYITYNSNFSWYYGTDGNTPSSQVDLMSVVLHEIAHGLNFSGSMRYASGQGQWGYGTGYPVIYDIFMKDGSGNLLINTAAYGNPSSALGSALTSDNLWFHGSNAMAANGGQRVKMYAPSNWASGSSYSHLDYNTFKGTANGLMVYAISNGVSIHDPGPVTLGLLKDLGWKMGISPPSLKTKALPWIPLLLSD